MFLFFGQRLGGVVRRCGGTYVATGFVHVNLVPIWPTRSFLFLDEDEVAEIPLDRLSIVAGYLRGWGLVVALLATVAWVFGWAGPEAAAWAAVVGVVAAGAGAAVGTLGPTERAQRRVYAEHAGRPIDVALLDPARRRALADRLQAAIADRAASHVGTSYRESLSPATDWGAIALDPTVEDRELVAMAMTLARLRSAEAEGAERARLDALHDALWERVRAG